MIIFYYILVFLTLLGSMFSIYLARTFLKQNEFSYLGMICFFISFFITLLCFYVIYYHITPPYHCNRSPGLFPIQYCKANKVSWHW